LRTFSSGTGPKVSQVLCRSKLEQLAALLGHAYAQAAHKWGLPAQLSDGRRATGFGFQKKQQAYQPIDLPRSTWKQLQSALTFPFVHNEDASFRLCHSLMPTMSNVSDQVAK